MKLLPLDSAERIELAAGWLARKENYQWLDFGAGRQVVTPALLKIMSQRDTHFMRLYTADGSDRPIGIVGLNSIDRVFRSATFWAAAGDKSFRQRGYATHASARFLSLAFRELGLNVINTWALEHNPSLRGIERLEFRYVGRQRQCHYIDGKPYDRLLFDLLASEHRDLVDARRQRGARRRQGETLDVAAG